jgi:hypothetical protein
VCGAGMTDGGGRPARCVLSAARSDGHVRYDVAVRRVLRHLVVFGLLGFSITLGTVVASALLISLDEVDPVTSEDLAEWRMVAKPLPDGTVRKARVLTRFSARRIFSLYRSRQNVSSDDDLVVYLSRDWSFPEWVPDAEHGVFDSEYEARGWPCYALWCEFPFDGGDESLDRGIAGGFDLRFPRPPPRDPARGYGFSGSPMVPPAIPLRPVWPGLLANTVFYRVILWAL